MLPTLIQRYDKKNHFISRTRDHWNFTGCQVPHFMIVLIPCTNLLNLSWLIKCLFLRTVEPLTNLLMVKLLTVVAKVFSNTLIFFCKNVNAKATHIFSVKNISVFAIFQDRNFNPMLANNFIKF